VLLLSVVTRPNSSEPQFNPQSVLSDYGQKQPRRRKNRIEGAGAYAGVSEFKRGWSVCVLIVRSETQPEFVTCPRASGVGYERNPVVHFFSNWHSFESPARHDRGTGLGRGFVHCPQARPEISRRDIDGIVDFVHFLQDGNEGCVRRGASGVQLQFDGTGQIQVMRQGRGRPV
jgi:hypothetical protein